MARQNENRLPTHERLLIWFFAVLVILNVIHVLIGFASLADYYRRVTSLTIETVEMAGEVQFSNLEVQDAAQMRGMTLSVYALYQILFKSLLVGIYVLIAGIVLWKGRRQWFAWYTAALMLFLAGYTYIDQIYAARLVPLEWLELSSLLWPLVLLYMYLFPNGKAVPRWSRAPMFFLCTLFFLLMASFMYAVFFPGRIEPLLQLLLPYGLVFISFAFGLILICQIVRYRSHSTAVERQQTKWFLFGLFLAVLTIPLEFILAESPWYAEYSALNLIWLPISLAIAILRYRLWEIDLIIRKTLLYGTLTASLILIYFGLVTVLQNLLAGASRQQSPLAIVVSTLAIAALFNPVRIRLQAFLDRRFYRAKYDAEQALNDFSVQARSETDPGVLADELAQVIQKTIQPEQLTFWLKTTTRAAADRL